MLFRNVIVDFTISSGSFVFSQSRVEVELSTSLSNVGGLAVGAFDLMNRSLLVVRSVPVLTLVSKCRNEVVGLWATRIL